MLTSALSHAASSTDMGDLWLDWNPQPTILLGLLATAYTYQRGHTRTRHPPPAWRARCFWAGILAAALALLSPLDNLSDVSASAHMTQHVLLTLAAAPLLALGTASGEIMRALPLRLRRLLSRSRRRLRPAGTPRKTAWAPVVAWVFHTGALWFWHASTPYTAALEHHAVHLAQHLSFFVTALLFWSTIVAPKAAHLGVYGYRILLVFAMAIQSVLLAVLLTFAPSPWYAPYVRAGPQWGIDPLADQQLAGAIMWVPAGAIYVVAALLLLRAWLVQSGASERTADPLAASGMNAVPGPSVS